MTDATIFHKSVFPSRSAGYTSNYHMSTSTGEKKHTCNKDAAEENLFDRKIRDLKRAMTSKIENEVEQMAEARVSMLDKMGKIEKKIDSMIDLQESINMMRKNLSQAEISLVELLDKVEKVELFVGGSENTLTSQTRALTPRPKEPIFEDEEMEISSTITRL